MICRFSVIEDVYREPQDPTSVKHAKSVEFEDALVKLYSHVLLYQVRLVTQLSRSNLGQLARDLIKSNDWTALLTSIRDAETELNQRRQVLDSGRLNRGLSHQSQQMDKMLEAHRELGKVTRETLDIVHEQERHRRTEAENRCHAAFRVSDYMSDRIRNPMRVPGTCGWFIEHGNYHKWRDNDSNDLLWVSADPGCGKSVLSRFLVEKLLPSDDTNVCYFFFKDEGKQQKSASSAVCALLHQLYSKSPALIKHALPVFNKEGEKLQDLFSDLWAILQASLTDSKAGNMICVLDALDECEESGRILLIDALKQFRSKHDWDSTHGYVKFLVTSRPYQSIERKFRFLENAMPRIRLAGEDETESIKREIDLVIKHRVAELRDVLDLDTKAAENLELKLISMDHRTYLWLKLVLFELENNFSASTSKKLLAFIEVIPKTVDEAYEAILNRSTDKQLARKILNIVVAAQRPLTLNEMDVALAIGDSVKFEAELDLEGERNLRSHIRNLCGLFLNVTDSKIYLIHQTAREFLMGKDYDAGESGALNTPHGWKHSLNSIDSSGLLAKICLRYISLEELNRCPLKISEPEREPVRYSCHGSIVSDDINVYLRDHSFLDYSCKSWISHVQKADVQDGSPLLKLMAHVCDTSSKRFLLWYSLHMTTKVNPPHPSELTSLSLAASNGLVPLLRFYLNQGRHPDAKGVHCWTALHFAAQLGVPEVVGVLLEFGADISAETYKAETPLCLAATDGHEEIVIQLLDKGADLKSRTQLGKTPLLCASGHGHLSVVSLLLAHGADIQASDNEGRTSLIYAASGGRLEVVELFLKKGADVEAAQTDGVTPLLIAAAALSRSAARPDCDSSYASNLKAELESDLDMITRMLLKYGADPTTRDKEGKRPLEWEPEKYTELRAVLKAAEAEWTSSHSLQADRPLDAEKDKLGTVLQ